jgi:spore coat polysaccharide biosynthesis predicted glycosyltransferase SpsG
MRSSAIAEELITGGEEVFFVGEISDLPWVERRIARLGFNGIYAKCNDFISKPETDVLILDSYDIPLTDEFIAPKNWHRIISIVDQVTPNYHCSLRIHPGLDSNWTGGSRIPILSGPRYIPFRSSIAKSISFSYQKGRVLRIAVVAGGSDPFELVHKIARILVEFSEEIEVLLFSNNTSDLIGDPRFCYVELSEDFDELTREVDLILTTASTSSLEFLARGFCVGIACAVDNQQQYFDNLGELGVASQIGSRSADNNWDIDKEKIHLLVTSNELRENLKSKAKGLIDFQGASRIVHAIKLLCDIQ